MSEDTIHVFKSMAQPLSSVAFLFYGLQCVFTAHMIKEFERYSLEKFRVLTGALEIAGGVGLAAGYFFPLLTTLASAGLAILMLLGVATRIRIGDSFVQSLPALTLFLINSFIFLNSLNR